MYRYVMLKLQFSAFFKYTRNYYRYTLMFIHVLLTFYFEFSKIRDFGLGPMDIEGLHNYVYTNSQAYIVNVKQCFYTYNIGFKTNK